MHASSGPGYHSTPSARSLAPIPFEPGAGKVKEINYKVASVVREVGMIARFPQFKGERVYMQPFYKHGGEILLPIALCRWEPVVSAMLESVETSEKMFLMVDQGEVKAGGTQRRPGPHIDGNWIEGPETDGRIYYPETILLASDVAGCVAYSGPYDCSKIGEKGDCSKINLTRMKRTRMAANTVYAGNVWMIHESIPVKKDCQRTLVRINVPRHDLK